MQRAVKKIKQIRMKNQLKILVLEDEPDLCQELTDYLQFASYHAVGVGTAAALHDQLDQGSWDIVLLDLGLPDADGNEVAKQLRARFGLRMGLIMTTARGHIEDRIQGLNSGADIYLIKPVDMRELQAVINQLAKRMGLGTWTLDSASLRLRTPNGGNVPLTGAEVVVLELLLAQSGQPIDRVTLSRALAPGGDPNDTRRLDALFSRLRNKVEQHAKIELPVHTFRNMGYAFTGEASTADQAGS